MTLPVAVPRAEKKEDDRCGRPPVLRQHQLKIGTEAVQQGEQFLHRCGVLEQALLHGLFRRQAAFEQGHHLKAGAGEQGGTTVTIRPVRR